MTGSQSGKPLRVSNAFAKIISGTVNAVAASATALGASETIYEVLVQNSASSANTVLVGSSHRQDVEIAAGNHIVIPIGNLAQVYVRGSGGAATVNFIAMA